MLTGVLQYKNSDKSKQMGPKVLLDLDSKFCLHVLQLEIIIYGKYSSEK